jgi:RHS repeat-associated protein
MNRIKVYLLGFIFLCTINLYAQKTLTINTTQSSANTYDHQAINYIDLTPGFVATPNSGKNVTARINEKINTEAGNISSNPSAILNRPGLNTSYRVGTSTGLTSVGPGGQAIHEIPIFASPGTNEVSPSVSLQYVSQQEAGIAGYGWDIKGLSSITRMPQNNYYDGQTDIITYTNADAFAMDGQRLLIVSGSNGTNGTIYATESESFVKVTSFGTSGNGPQWFEVRTKEGIIIEYGNTIDSRLENGSTVFAWKINKVTDANGNYMLFSYVKEANESVIDKISYTGNAAQGVQPYNALEFYYDRKTDDGIKYLNGKSISNSFLLRKIKCINEGSLVKMYDFTYKKELYTKLIEIVESSGYGGERYNSTLISWEDDIATSSSSSLPLRAVVGKGDANGDGIADLVVYDPNPGNPSLKLLLSDQLSTTEYTICSYNYPGIPPQVSMVNFDDGDNRDEIYVRIFNGSTYSFQKYILSGNSVNQDGNNALTALAFAFQSPADKDQHNIIPLELNGDGKQEFAFVRTWDGSNYISTIISLSGNNYASQLPSHIRTYTAQQRIGFIDFNGNGKTDIITTNSTGNNVIYELNSSAVYTSIASGYYYNFDDKDVWGDFNGDGNTDLLVLQKNALGSYHDAAYLYYSNGLNSFVYQSSKVDFLNTKISGDLYGYTISINDFNADGKSDILFNSKNNSPSAMEIFYCNGKDFAFANTITVPNAYEVKTWFFTDLNGDGKCDSYGVLNNSGTYSSHRNLFKYNASNTGGNVVTEIVNGLNLVTKFDYVKLTEGRALTNYTAQPYLFMSSNYGILNMPQIVVKKIYTFEYGLNERYEEVEYLYENAIYHKGGKGFLGFGSLLKYYSFNNNHLRTEYEEFGYDNTYHVMFPSTRWNWQPKAGVIFVTPAQHTSRQSYSFSVQSLGGKRFWLKPVSVTQEDVLNNLAQNTIYNTFDAYGNSTRITMVKGSMSTISDYSYVQAGAFCPNKVSSQTITMKKTGKPDITRTTEFTYDTKGNLATITQDPATTKVLTTTISYSSNQCGMPYSKTISGTGITSRSETFTYDNKFRFVQSHFNVLNQESKFTYDTKFGNLLTQTGVDGKVSSNQYDAFGELDKNTDIYGTITDFVTSWNTSPVYGNLFNTYVHKEGTPDAWVFYDLKGRTKQKRYANPKETTMVVDVKYLSDGRLDAETKPYFSGGTSSGDAVKIEYDVHGRTLKVLNLGRETAYDYSNNASLRKTIKTVKGSGGSTLKTYASTLDDAGLMAEMADDAGNILYDYNSAGQVLSTTCIGITTSITYDAFGRQISLNDPSAGNKIYNYNALGELIYEEDARGVTKDMQYDIAGRLTQITEQPGNKTTSYSYVGSGNGINQVSQATTSDAINQLFEYDQFGNMIKLTEAIEGENLVTNYNYNGLGQLASLTYPSGYQLNYSYNTTGYPSVISNGQNQGIWSIGNFNTMGQPTIANLSNDLKFKYTYDSYFQAATRSINNNLAGLPNQPDPSVIRMQEYVFDPYTENMTSRKDVVKNFTEVFSYDNLDRLTTANPNAQPTPLTISYQPNGNIKNKNDISASDYEYNNTPYAVTDIKQPFTSIPTLQQNATYNNNNLTQTITEGTHGFTVKYGHDLQRRKTILTNNGSTVKTRLYAGDYEKEITPAGTKEYHYIYTPSGLTAVIIRQNGQDNFYYTFTDHLGSITSLVNTSGQVVEDYSYNAWGKRRNPNNWNDGTTPTGPFLVSRGYTGHEHHDEFGIINMNARMYDPVVGRVMSSDNLVQAPANTQSYNRYSYAWNNPMKYTDPDGNFVFLGLPVLFWAIAAYTAVGSAMVMTGHNTSQSFTAAVAAAATVASIGLTSTIGSSFAGNTLSLTMGSATTSSAVFVASSGRSELVVNFGAASYNFSKNELGYLAKKGNSVSENIGYTVGALVNTSDVLAGVNPGDIELQTENMSDGNSKDLIGHSQLNHNGEVLVDFGPTGDWSKFEPGRNDWINYASDGKYNLVNEMPGNQYRPVKISGVNLNRMNRISTKLNSDPGIYNVLTRSCSSTASRALTLSGVPAVGIHPYILHGQMYLRSIGLRPAMFSYYLNKN